MNLTLPVVKQTVLKAAKQTVNYGKQPAAMDLSVEKYPL
jgi:hypothetical protein